MSAWPICKLDVSELAKRLEDDGLFGLYNWRKDKYAHKDMKDIWVRHNSIENLGEGFNDEHDSVWYPIIKDIPEVLPVVFELMATVRCERLGGVLITKLAPGGKIAPHVDEGWHAGYYDKFYVPIKNEKGSKFCWEDIELEPEAGEVYEFKNNVPHWVNNDSSSDRIAMIVCMRRFNESIKRV